MEIDIHIFFQKQAFDFRQVLAFQQKSLSIFFLLKVDETKISLNDALTLAALRGGLDVGAQDITELA